jgi:hypothetical protein
MALTNKIKDPLASETLFSFSTLLLVLEEMLFKKRKTVFWGHFGMLCALDEAAVLYNLCWHISRIHVFK